MIFSPDFNATIGSCLIIILIAVDYIRKYNTDNFQRKLFVIMLGAVFIAAIFDYIGVTLEKISYKNMGLVLRCVRSVNIVNRTAALYYTAAFIDYFAHGNAARTKRFFVIISAFLVLFGVSVLVNIQEGFYFYISRENSYMPGTLYSILLLLSYIPVFIILIDISLATKHIKRSQVILTVFFVIITAVGAGLDIILRTTNLTWPCITASMLYVYFFILRAGAKIDSLTGIGNRNSFNEYINELSKQTDRKNYAFILIDLDRFKEINDTLGHSEGNNALRDLAAIIKGCIRHDDYAVRFGSDEFILITNAENDTQRIIDRINNAIDAQNKKKMRPYRLYISYGYDVYTTNSNWRIEDFLSHIGNKMNKYRESHREDLPSSIISNGEENV